MVFKADIQSYIEFLLCSERRELFFKYARLAEFRYFRETVNTAPEIIRRRFGYLEQNTIKQGKSLKDMTLAQMDEYWDKAKELERKGEL